MDREAALVALEVSRGLVSPEGAARYGVVIDKAGALDQTATEKLRKDMRASRGEVPVFDFGPDIDALRNSCESETGLPAPQQPVWNH